MPPATSPRKTPSSLAAIRAACASLPAGDAQAVWAIAGRETELTKPPGSLGRLEAITSWLGRWQERARPKLDRVQILVFAGNHGVVAQGVSPYPPDVTGQMVGNFAAGGAAINQLARTADASLGVVTLADLRPTADMTVDDAMTEAEFLAAFIRGFEAVPDCDLLALGEMGIGNTTAAAALAAGLFGGRGADWAGRGTGLDDAGVARKAEAIDRALARGTDAPRDPLEAARRFGGHETAAILGATLHARLNRIPVLLDGFVCTAAASPLARLAPDGLAHTMLAHRSAEAAHGRLAETLGLAPLLDLGMRLGEASGAAVAIPILRAALACHAGMATFADARVSQGSISEMP